MCLPFHQTLNVVFLGHNSRRRRRSFALNHWTENIEKDVGCQRFQINRVLRIAVMCSPESDVNSEGHGSLREYISHRARCGHRGNISFLLPLRGTAGENPYALRAGV